MTLTLRVISAQCQELGQDCLRQFGTQGGRIGRCDDNEWVLPDPDRYLSSYHAQISFDAGRWILEDLSTNGVYVNDAALPISQLGPCELHDGDQLRMGDYQILVSLNDHNKDKTTHPIHKSSTKDKKTRKAAASAPLNENDLKFDLDLSDLFNGHKPKNTPSTTKHGQQIRSQPKNKQPSHYEERLADRTTALQQHKTEEPSTVTMDGTSLHGLAAFCKGAGIDIHELPVHSDAALLSLAGQLLRTTVLELMAIEKTHGENRSTPTPIDSAGTIRPNDWIKNSTSVNEALTRLLNAGASGRANPADNIRNSFNNLRHHERATIDALLIATNKLMERFDPEELKNRFDRILSRSKSKKTDFQQQYWSMYVELFQAINQRNKEGLPANFAEELAQAYQDRLIALTEQEKDKKTST